MDEDEARVRLVRLERRLALYEQQAKFPRPLLDVAELNREIGKMRLERDRFIALLKAPNER